MESPSSRRADASHDPFAPYLETWRRRREQDERERLERQQRAWAVARHCAQVLRREFCASRVAVYGSLARDGLGLHSDIDLASWGIPRSSYVDAVARLIEEGEDFEVNLALYESCREPMQWAIDRDAVELQ